MIARVTLKRCCGNPSFLQQQEDITSAENEAEGAEARPEGSGQRGNVESRLWRCEEDVARRRPASTFLTFCVVSEAGTRDESRDAETHEQVSSRHSLLYSRLSFISHHFIPLYRQRKKLRTSRPRWTTVSPVLIKAYFCTVHRPKSLPSLHPSAAGGAERETAEEETEERNPRTVSVLLPAAAFLSGLSCSCLLCPCVSGLMCRWNTTSCRRLRSSRNPTVGPNPSNKSVSWDFL